MSDKPICKITDVPVNGIKQFETATGEGIALCDGAFDGDAPTCMEHLWQWNLRQGGNPQGSQRSR